MEKRVKKPYVHQSYPKMVYHLTTGEWIICDCEEDIPEGYGAQKDVVLETMPDTDDNTSAELKEAYDKGFADGLVAGTKSAKKTNTKKPAEKKVEKKVEKKSEKHVPTLGGLKLTRKEAKEILKEDGIAFAKNASDDNLASKIEKLLKDDKSE